MRTKQILDILTTDLHRWYASVRNRRALHRRGIKDAWRLPISTSCANSHKSVFNRVSSGVAIVR
jgi:hypothetical protein